MSVPQRPIVKERERLTPLQLVIGVLSNSQDNGELKKRVWWLIFPSWTKTTLAAIHLMQTRTPYPKANDLMIDSLMFDSAKPEYESSSITLLGVVNFYWTKYMFVVNIISYQLMFSTLWISLTVHTVQLNPPSCPSESLGGLSCIRHNWLNHWCMCRC